MSRNRVALILSIFVLFMVAIAAAPVEVAASACDVRAKAPSSARTFAKTSIVSDWREVASGDDVANLVRDSGMSAQTWQDHGKKRSVMIIEPGQDFSMVTRYCYDSQGALAGVGLEIRTLLGWGHRVEGHASGREFVETSSEYFNLNNGKAVPKPLDAARVPRALQPVLYLKESELPFASLLTVITKTKKHSRGAGAPISTESVVETAGIPSGN